MRLLSHFSEPEKEENNHFSCSACRSSWNALDAQEGQMKVHSQPGLFGTISGRFSPLSTFFRKNRWLQRKKYKRYLNRRKIGDPTLAFDFLYIQYNLSSEKGQLSHRFQSKEWQKSLLRLELKATYTLQVKNTTMLPALLFSSCTCFPFVSCPFPSLSSSSSSLFPPFFHPPPLLSWTDHRPSLCTRS